MGKLLFRCGVSFWGHEIGGVMDVGDGITILWMQLMPLNFMVESG